MTLPQVLSTFFLVPVILACLVAVAYNARLTYRGLGSYHLGEYLLGVVWFWFCAGVLTLLYGALMGWWGQV